MSGKQWKIYHLSNFNSLDFTKSMVFYRLTPAYFIVIGLYATWLPKLGSGPLWNSRMTEEQNRCLSSWWLNLLYINNYVGTDQLVRYTNNLLHLCKNHKYI